VDDISQWLTQLRKGTVELLVLRLLVRDGELHGYAIVKELQSLGRLIAGESTVYPVLRRMESDGLVGSRWVESDAGPPRKYYSISDEGDEFLAAAEIEWDALVTSLARLRGGDGNGN
jgi:PadR family transcriptional regulator PadR